MLVDTFFVVGYTSLRRLNMNEHPLAGNPHRPRVVLDFFSNRFLTLFIYHFNGLA